MAAVPEKTPPRQPSPPAGNGPPAAAVEDLDLQAVGKIPKDTLVALLKRKDREAKGLVSKLEKLEERYVKVVRFNKILMEDRTSFLRFCNELLPESDAAFEEAAAQEIPVNLEALVNRLQSWRGTFEAARDDRRIFQQFVELAFPGDEVVAQLFAGPALGPEAFDMLQHRWVATEDLHNQSIASMNSLARQQVMAKSREMEAETAARREAEKRCEDLREQLTRVAREKAQILTQRFQGGASSTEAAAEPSSSENPPLPDVVRSGSSAGARGGGGGGDLHEQLHLQLREAQEARDDAERRERRFRDAAEASAGAERDLRTSFETQQAETRRLQGEVERLRDDSERHRNHALQLLQQKDDVLSRLQERMAELEQELSSNSFIERFAEQQAGRDAEVKAQRKQMDHLHETLCEIQKLLGMSYTQERALKDRIRELEGSRGRTHVAGDYLKHVVLKYVEYSQKGDMKAQALVPVICTLLNLKPEERRSVDKSAIPNPLLVLNQAVGEATSWLRGDSAQQANLGVSFGETGIAPHPALETAELTTLLAGADPPPHLPEPAP